jgi:hypothetical protein
MLLITRSSPAPVAQDTRTWIEYIADLNEARRNRPMSWTGMITATVAGDAAAEYLEQRRARQEADRRGREVSAQATELAAVAA